MILVEFLPKESKYSKNTQSFDEIFDQIYELYVF